MSMQARCVLIMAALAVAGCQTMEPKRTPIDAAASSAGMMRVLETDLDALYLKADAEFSKYTKVLLRPATISFSKSWKPEKPGSLTHFTDAEIELIRSELSQTFNKAFGRALQEGRGLQIVSDAGPDVLELSVEVVDVFVPAPDLSRYSSTRTQAFTREGTEMTLLAEMRDSLSGEPVGKAYDAHRASQSARLELANQITNAAEARRITAAWADALRSALMSTSQPAG